MAWADLASNQMVSFTDAQSGGFSLNSGQSQTTSNQCMTKSDALTKYNLNASLMSSFANNQLVPKSTWASAAVVAYHYYVSSYSQATSSSSCNKINNGATVVFLYASNNTGFFVGQVLYTDGGLTTTFNGNDLYWGTLNGDAIVPDTTSAVTIKVSPSGVVLEVFTCPSIFYGGAMTLNVPGAGNNIPPNAPGSGVISGYTLNSGITINNTSGSETVLFKSASLSNPYPIIAQSGATRLMQFASSTTVNINTAPQDGSYIPPSSGGTFLSFGKSSGSGLVVLSLETQTPGGGRQQVFWTFNI